MHKIDLLYEFVQELISNHRYGDAYEVCMIINIVRKEDKDGN